MRNPFNAETGQKQTVDVAGRRKFLRDGSIAAAAALLATMARTQEAQAMGPELPAATLPEGWFDGGVAFNIPEGQTLPALPEGTAGKVKMAMMDTWFGGEDEKGIDYTAAQELLRWAGKGAGSVEFVPELIPTPKTPQFKWWSVPGQELVLEPGRFPQEISNADADTEQVELEIAGRVIKCTFEAAAFLLQQDGLKELGGTLRNRIDDSLNYEEYVRWQAGEQSWVIPGGARPPINFAPEGSQMDVNQTYRVIRWNESAQAQLTWNNLTWYQVQELGSDYRGLEVIVEKKNFMPFTAKDTVPQQ